MMKVRETLDNGIPSVPPGASIAKVSKEMNLSGEGVVVVCDRGKYRGLIERRDLATRISKGELNPEKARARSVAKRDWPLISPGASAWDALKLMMRSRVEVLPVVQNGRFMGMLSLESATRDSPALRAMALIRSQREGQV